MGALATLAWLLLLAAALFLGLRASGAPALGGRVSWADLVAAISAGGSLVSMLGTVSATMLAWRRERRDAADFRRRLDELEARPRD